MKFHKGGIFTTIQDLGRNNFRRFGINPNGAMDRRAARLINILVGNPENSPVIEMHFPAPVIEFESETAFALGGADFGARLDDRAAENWQVAFAKKGQILSFAEKLSGNRAYLAISGDIEIEQRLNSASTNIASEFGGFRGRTLRSGDRLEINSDRLFFPLKLARSFTPSDSSAAKIRIVKGAEFKYLTGLSEIALRSDEFKISPDSDRMGFRLAGEPLYLLDNIEILSSAVDFGTVQLLPNGQMIILMADHQTTGGYPRIAHVISVDLPVLAQFGVNDNVAFEFVSQKKAEDLLLEFENDLGFLKTGCVFARMKL